MQTWVTGRAIIGSRTIGDRARTGARRALVAAAIVLTVVACSTPDSSSPDSSSATTATAGPKTPVETTSESGSVTVQPSGPSPVGPPTVAPTAVTSTLTATSVPATTGAPTSTIVLTRVTGTTPAATDPAATGPSLGTTTSGGSEVMPTSGADEPAAAPSAPLDNASGQSQVYSGIGQVTGFGSSCTGFLLDLGPATGPAYALTNGHCVGIFDATTVLSDEPVTHATITFRRFHDTADKAREVPIHAVRYATMRGTDVAVLQLGATRTELSELAAYRLGAAPAEGTAVRVVGIPVNGLAPVEQVLRVSGCTAGGTSRLLEWRWLWDSAQANDCAGIVGGSSGSPVFSAGSPLVVLGIVNTTTIGAGDLPGCYLGQPCEVSRSGVRRSPSTSYAMPVAGWSRCFGRNGFDASAVGCPTERDTVDVTNPAISVPRGSTWDATVTGTEQPLVKSGPLPTTNCRVATGYTTDPAAPSAALPDQDGYQVLCAAAAGADGRAIVSGAGAAVVVVDQTPPTAPIRLATVVTADDVRFEPVFDPPEYASFQLKAGPQAAMDCADPDGYAIYRRIPLTVAIADLPATICVIGEDEAGNRGTPHSFVLT